MRCRKILFSTHIAITRVPGAGWQGIGVANRRGVRRGGDEGRCREREAGFVSLGQELSAQEKFQVCVKGGIWRPGQT